MRHSISKSSLILSAVAALLLAVVIPSTALAQGRGHGRGHGGGDWSNRIERNGVWSNNVDRDRDRSNRGWRNRSSNWPNYNKKCGKFVNCHDARAGRIDGRGPRGSRVGNVVWPYRLRNRRFMNNDNLVIRNRSNNNFWRNRNRRNLRRVTENR
jgi:hypothetical protein